MFIKDGNVLGRLYVRFSEYGYAGYEPVKINYKKANELYRKPAKANTAFRLIYKAES